MQGSSGEPRFLHGILVDITEQKKTEKELKSSRQQLRDLAAHLETVREEERTWIAREIHDELGQSLTGLKMELSWLDKKISDPTLPGVSPIPGGKNRFDEEDCRYDHSFRTQHRHSAETGHS